LTQLTRLKKATETELRRFYVAACTSKFGDVRLFIRNVSVIPIEDRFVRSSISGQADVWGLLYRPPYPMHIEIELKNVHTKDTDEQIKWRAYCDEHGTPFLYMRAQTDHTPAQIIEDWVQRTDVWLKELRER
jgi:hypothetical protein